MSYAHSSEIPRPPRPSRAPGLGYGGRVGGRYVLTLDLERLPHWTSSAASTRDEYPCLEDDVDYERVAAVDAAIAQLDDDLRDVVEMVLIGSAGHREAARQLGIDHKTVARRLKRAKAQLVVLLSAYSREAA
jgi:DNA-directed RNA polymerase specialized sigma24 family protein